jgi:hypothetical protein
MARPLLRRGMRHIPTALEKKLDEQSRGRVIEWDRPGFESFYENSDRKKRESRATESVLNALIVSLEDQHSGGSISKATLLALATMWKTQSTDGTTKGSWEWLDFGLEPWESGNARYYGSALAAIAVGTAPGYYLSFMNDREKAQLDSLRKYLKDAFANQNLHNQLWALWASTKIDRILPQNERDALIARILAVQKVDGGWSLGSLGQFQVRVGAPPADQSDAYATGFVTHVLQLAGRSATDDKITNGLNWLRRNQAAAGEWHSKSLNSQRDPASDIGKFMSDAATAFAVLALSH